MKTKSLRKFLWLAFALGLLAIFFCPINSIGSTTSSAAASTLEGESNAYSETSRARGPRRSSSYFKPRHGSSFSD